MKSFTIKTFDDVREFISYCVFDLNLGLAFSMDSNFDAYVRSYAWPNGNGITQYPTFTYDQIAHLDAILQQCWDMVTPDTCHTLYDIHESVTEPLLKALNL